MRPFQKNLVVVLVQKCHLWFDLGLRVQSPWVIMCGQLHDGLSKGRGGRLGDPVLTLLNQQIWQTLGYVVDTPRAWTVLDSPCSKQLH